MSLATLENVTGKDKDHIFDVLEDETYPCSATDIRMKLKKSGVILPEYLITRSLRILLSEGKAQLNGRKWSISSSFESKGSSIGYAPRKIELPIDIFKKEPVSPIIGPKSPPEVEVCQNNDSSKILEPFGDPDIDLAKGPWGKFRNIISYYMECVRNEEGASASSFIDEIGKKYFFVNSIANSFPKTGKSWSYVIPMGDHTSDFANQLAKNKDDNIVIFGYPIEAVKIKKDNQPDVRMIRPVFQFVLSFEGFANNSMTLKTLNAQPEISFDWMKYALTTYSEKFHFLSHCGLINQQQPLDEPMGFTSDDSRPNLDELANRLSTFLPKKVIEPLSLNYLSSRELPVNFKNGIYNKAVIMIGTRTKFSQTLLKELEFIRKLDDDTLNKTSLKYLFKNTDSTKVEEKNFNHEGVVADAISMNKEQRESVASLLGNNLSLVTGPPGTGKSQVVMATVANLILQGKSILFSSRNHKAIDSVVERLKDQNGYSIIKRGNSKDASVSDYTFANAITDITSNSSNNEIISGYNRRLDQLNDKLKHRGKYASTLEIIWSLSSKIGDYEEDLAWLRDKKDPLISKLDENNSVLMLPNNTNLKKLIELLNHYKSHHGFYDRLEYFVSFLRIFRLWYSSKRILKGLIPDPDWQSRIESLLKKIPPLNTKNIEDINLDLLGDINKFINCNKEMIPLLKELKGLDDLSELVIEVKKISEEIQKKTEQLISMRSQTFGQAGHVDESNRNKLIQLGKALKEYRSKSFEDKSFKDEMEKRLLDYTPFLLEQFPAWAVTNLSVGRLIPLAPGIFDLSVFDEASQCDIASAIPILFRSKRAAVVGDPNQLKHISKMTAEKDSLTRKKYNLKELDDLIYSYRSTSIYEFFQNTSSVVPHKLKDTYRSTFEIAEYSNNVFYDGILRVATNEEDLITPKGTKPGFHWTDVSGPVVSAGKSGCVSESEVEEIYKLVKSILVDNIFKGTLGVVTPFRQQQKRLHDRIYDSDIPFEKLESAQFVAETAHNFQGDEKDVMIFSLCAGEDMPRGSLYFISQNSHLFNVAVSRARAVMHLVGNKTWAEKCGIKHIEHLARPTIKKNTVTDKGPWYPHESPWEKIFFEELLKKGIKTIPQYPVSGRRLDLALIKSGLFHSKEEGGLKLDIEIDSDGFHRNPDGSRKIDDTWRDIYLMGLGWKVKRFWVYNLKDNMKKCVSEIEEIWREDG